MAFVIPEKKPGESFTQAIYEQFCFDGTSGNSLGKDRTKQLIYPHVLWIDLGSYFDNGINYDLKVQILHWLCVTIRGRWQFTQRDRTVWGTNALGEQEAIDQVHELWISIEDRSDAMLSKLTWMDLRSKEHAEY